MRTVFLNLKGNLGDYASFPLFATRCGEPNYVEASKNFKALFKKYKYEPAISKNCKKFWNELVEIFGKLPSPITSNQKNLFDEMETYIGSIGEKIAYCNIRLKRSLVENVDTYVNALASNPCVETFLALMVYGCSMEDEPETLDAILSDEITDEYVLRYCKRKVVSEVLDQSIIGS